MLDEDVDVSEPLGPTADAKVDPERGSIGAANSRVDDTSLVVDSRRSKDLEGLTGVVGELPGIDVGHVFGENFKVQRLLLRSHRTPVPAESKTGDRCRIERPQKDFPQSGPAPNPVQIPFLEHGNYFLAH